MNVRILFLSLAAVFVISGCASTSTLSRSPTALTPADTTVDNSKIESECPPDTNGKPLERDLTVPFSQRKYLLPSGELCTPRPDSTRARRQVSAPSLPVPAEPDRRTSFFRRGLHDGR